MLSKFFGALAAVMALCSVLAAKSQTLSFPVVPTVLPHTTDLGNYSPLVGIAYSGLGNERYTLKVWLLELDTGAYYCASSVWCERQYVLDNQNGSQSAGTLWDAPAANVYTYQNLLWVTRLYDHLDQEVASALQPATTTANRPPVLNSVGSRVVTVNDSLDFVLAATNPDGGAVTFIARNLPTGATFNAATGAFHWQPAVPGTYNNIAFQVVQSGGSALSDAEIISIRVADAPPVEVSGIITLQGSVNSAQPVTFEFRPLDGSTGFVRTATLTTAGAFRLTDIPRKAYRIRIKSDKNLAVVVNADASGGNVANITALLRAGDANGDNAAGIADLLLLVGKFNKVAPDPDYSPVVDFNSDGADNILDLLLLIGNFNQRGDA